MVGYFLNMYLTILSNLRLFIFILFLSYYISAALIFFFTNS